MSARGLVVLRGAPADTARRAGRVIVDLDPGDVLWVGAPEPDVAAVVEGARTVVHRLGQAFDAVVLDAHGGLDPDVLGQVHGFVRGGGALVLRLDPPGGDDALARARLVVHPYALADVGRRFAARLERALGAAPQAPERPLARPRHAEVGTPEQAAVVKVLVERLAQPGTASVVLADRGRGKSSALGLALRALAGADAGRRIVVTAEDEAAAAEVFRHGGPALGFVPLGALLQGPPHWDVIAVDEAARVPVPVLKRLVERHPHAALVLATTVRGYEGTGRGFLLRFVDWLAARRPLATLELQAPIRWAAGCPLERFVFDALLLDAEPAAVADVEADAAVAFGPVDRDHLASPAGERDLRDLFGLLVHAHYRTTPSDLVRLLDAPNVALFAARRAGRIVAATLVAAEGGLPDALVAELALGRERIRAHAIPDALVVHMGHPEAGPLRVARSVRIATHPALRRLGLATRLVDHVHAAYDTTVDLVGTLFGATAELVAFRRALGYVLVRVSASRGTRTGEPSVLMLRPLTARAHALVATLRAELARDLPLQLALLQADDELLLDPALDAALRADLPDPAPLDDARAEALLRAYAFGACTIEAVATALVRWVATHPERLQALPLADRTIVEARVIACRSWSTVLRASGLPSHAAVMRALRRAVRALVAPDSDALR